MRVDAQSSIFYSIYKLPTLFSSYSRSPSPQHYSHFPSSLYLQ